MVSTLSTSELWQLFVLCFNIRVRSVWKTLGVIMSPRLWNQAYLFSNPIYRREVWDVLLSVSFVPHTCITGIVPTSHGFVRVDMIISVGSWPRWAIIISRRFYYAVNHNFWREKKMAKRNMKLIFYVRALHKRKWIPWTRLSLGNRVANPSQT